MNIRKITPQEVYRSPSASGTKKPSKNVGVTYAGNLGISSSVQPVSGGLAGGYAENINRYYGGGNTAFGSAVAGSNGGGFTDVVYGSHLGNSNGTVGSFTDSALAGKDLTGGLYGQNLERYFDSNTVGRVGADIGGGASRGGITNESVIVGESTGNFEKFPTINQGSEAVRQPSADFNLGLSGSVGSVAPGALKRPQDQLQQQKVGSVLDLLSPEQTPPAASAPKEEGSEPMTFEEDIEQVKKGYQEQLEATNREAEQTKERAMVDAQSSYMQNMANYGVNAEKMAQMGLQGSGYSDYLNAQAYAQKRADIQQANALEVTQKQAAESTYQDHINQLNERLANKTLEDQRLADQREYESKQLEDQRQYESKQLEDQRQYEKEKTDDAQLHQKELLEEQRAYEEAQYQRQKEESNRENNKGYFANLLDGANSGAYTAEQLDALGKQFGFNEEEMNVLRNAAENAKRNKQTQRFNDLNKNVPTTGTIFDEVQSAFNNGEISQAQYDTLMANYREQMYNEKSSALNSDFGSFDPSEVDAEYKAGHISQERYDELKRQYNSYIEGAIALKDLFITMNSGEVDATGAKIIMDGLISQGWMSEENKSKMQELYNNSFLNGGDSGGGCYAKGTLITMADGSQVPVEQLKSGDSVLVFNHETGELDVAPIAYIFYDGQKEYDVIRLDFGDKAKVEVLFGHSFFDTDLKKYVLINTDTVKEYVGHNFYYVSLENGEYKKSIATLTGYETYQKGTECFAVLSARHINCVANGLLNILDDGNKPSGLLECFTNVFELDDDYKFDREKMAADIEKYGLFTYDDWKEYVTEEQFYAFNGAYLKVAIGKGLITAEEIVEYIEKFLQPQE